MLTLERQTEILEYLKQKKTATVRELAAKLYVSDATIRRDLGEMEILGLDEPISIARPMLITPSFADTGAFLAMMPEMDAPTL